MKYTRYLLFLFFTVVGFFSTTVYAQEGEDDKVDVKGILFGHVEDSYGWHITTIGDKEITISLPVILYSKEKGWTLFSSKQLEKNDGIYQGYYIAKEGTYAGKIVEKNSLGEEVRPIDLSITKVTMALFINSALLLLIILGVANWYRKNDPTKKAPKGFVGFMEMFIMMINDEVIKPCVGENHQKFAPYLLTAFFFIFLNNMMGLIPIFPGGVTVTGNITITMFLALATFFVTNFFGSKDYWKEVFWPDVPTWLKAPIPIMPVIELFGLFTKPIALMIRLFANLLAGHMVMLILTCLVFITASFGPAINVPMSITSILFNMFMTVLEILVAFIQAYVFTMLSAVFIGLAQPHKKAVE
ncbi:MAG: F0F1 ATP synthase subunit A [Bacteroidales bacterium]|nr:F0F1 ATP synthase subunit A [Bacteroidales bacterium]